MNCPKGVCPETGNDPKITVTILDQDNGTLWGFYCNHDCALKDMGGALMHIIDGGDMASIPEPKPEDNPVDVSVMADPSTSSNGPAPAPNALEQELDASWHPNQKYLNNLCLELAKTLGCGTSSQGITTTPNGLKTEKIYLTYGASVSLSGDSVWIDLGNEDYNMLIDPATFSLSDAVKHSGPHIQIVVKQQKLNAATSPF